MDARIEVRSLGRGWIRKLGCEAHAALKDAPAAIGAGTVVVVALWVAMPSTTVGTVALTLLLVLTLGALSWVSSATGDESRRPLPVPNLILLGVALVLLQAPLLLLWTMASPALGLLVSVAVAMVAAATSPSGMPWLSLFASALIYGPFILGFCFAPHLVAARGLSAPQALRQSLRIWNRNPTACLTFFGLYLLLAAWKSYPLWWWIPLPLPNVLVVLHTAAWAIGGMLIAAALVGFGRAALAPTARDDSH